MNKAHFHPILSSEREHKLQTLVAAKGRPYENGIEGRERTLHRTLEHSQDFIHTFGS